MNQKRRLVDDRDYEPSGRVDEEQLLQQLRVLTRSEFLSVIPSGCYEEYRMRYYKNIFRECLERFRQKPWFQERYLSGNKYDGRFSLVSEQGDRSQSSWYRIQNVFEPAREIFDRYAGDADEIHICQNGFDYNFERDLYILSRAPVGNRRSIAFSYEIVDDNATFSEKQLRSVYRNLESMGMRHKESADVCIEDLDAKELTRQLRKDFLYCTTCNIRFDSEVQMYDVCSFSHEKAFPSHRTLELFIDLFRDGRSLLDSLRESSAWLRPYFHSSRDGIRCMECHKLFESEEGVTNHIVSVHTELANEITGLTSIVRNMDLFLLGWIDGTVTNEQYRMKEYSYTPWFGRERSEYNMVRYNLPRIYSGNLEE